MPPLPCWHRPLLALLALATGFIGSGAAYHPDPAPCATLTPAGDVPTWRLDQHPEVDAMAPTISAIVKRARISYPGPRGPIQGYLAGASYGNAYIPATYRIYARDTATIVPIARFVAGDPGPRSAVEEFLRLQYDDSTVSSDGDLGLPVGAGAVSGSIAPDFQVNKATETSDEETSLILAAVSSYHDDGDATWLAHDVAGRSVLDRLNAAMDWLLTHRLDPDPGLIKRGHTTDWGDVKMEPAPDPTDIGLWHVWTYSIYDQAIAFAALQGLAELNAAAGQPDQAAAYQQQAQALREATNNVLWMPDRGYYRIHLHAGDSPSPHVGFNEDDIVAIGNAAAIYYGLADGDRAGAIVRSLEAARLHAGAPKPGLTLEPPYPSGTFLQIQMDSRNYQNGALWDWWAGRQITAEYASGHAHYGDAHLLQVAADWTRHPGQVFEWESPWKQTRSPDGSYTGAAATVGEAVVRGLFGVTLQHGSLELAPRLAARSGAIALTDALSGVRVAYSYSVAQAGPAVDLCYATTVTGTVSLKLRLPDGLSVRSMTLDGVLIPTAAMQLNDDAYAVAALPSGAHHLVVALKPLPPPPQLPQAPQVP